MYVKIEDARKALDSMDDFARMDVGVDPFGPRKVIEDFFAQSEKDAEPVSKANEYPHEYKKLQALVGDLEPILEDVGAIIAGGAITSVFTNQEVNDLDIYFPNKESFSRFITSMLLKESGFQNFVHMTDRSILMTNHQEVKAQLIYYRFHGTAEDIFEDFDFSVNMGAYDFGRKCFVLHKDFLRHNAQRYFTINPFTAYPLISMLRVDKYQKKGYTTSKPQVLRLLLAITQLELDGWDDVVSQIGGMYGVNPEKLFDRSKEFSIDEVILQLDKVEALETSDYIQGVDFVDFKKNLESSITPELFNIIKGQESFYFYGKREDQLEKYMAGVAQEEPYSLPEIPGFSTKILPV